MSWVAADIAEWKLCVCVKRTRFTAQTKRELWHPSTKRRGGNERIRSLQAFGRWSTERLRAKRKNNSLFEHLRFYQAAANLFQSWFEKSCKCCSAFHPTGPSLRSGLLVSRKQLLLSDFLAWFVHRLQGIPVKWKATRQGRQEQVGKIRGGDVLCSLWIGQAGGVIGRALLPDADKCDFPFILINESRLAIRSKLLVTVAKKRNS